jgi:exopolysaccharide biosynthesis polyprenyl glycosylphosphotransferase
VVMRVAQHPGIARRVPVRSRRRTTVQIQMRMLGAAVAAADTLVICVSVCVAWTLRSGLGFTDKVLAPPHLWIGGAAAVIGLWLALLAAGGAYSPRIFGGGPEEFKIVVMSTVLTAGTVGFAFYLSDSSVSRGFVVLTFCIGVSLLVGERFAVRMVVQSVRRRGHLLHRVIAVGGPNAINELVNILYRERYVGYQVVGACVPKNNTTMGRYVSVPVLGAPDDARAVCSSVGADTVLITGGSFSSSDDLRRVGWQLEGSSIDLVVIPSLAEVAGPRIHLRPVAGLPLMHVEPPQADAAGRWSKRLFDIVGALIALVLFAPIMAALALAIKIQDGGPILFRQARVGRNGSTFRCLKLRSMSVDAESRLTEIQHLNESGAVLFKVRGDPRITGVGRFIRRYSFDELPQLLNVLRGTMSLVGPRPPLPTEVEAYDDDVRRRLLVRPGMTGLWQVSGRSQLSWRESIRLDLYYVDNWSMVGDLVILAKTLQAVLSTRGSY